MQASKPFGQHAIFFFLYFHFILFFYFFLVAVDEIYYALNIIINLFRSPRIDSS